MPCEELADAIVSKGRETLERAIEYIHENSTYMCNNQTNNVAKYGNARVIYGDTDSLFILFKGDFFVTRVRYKKVYYFIYFFQNKIKNLFKKF